MKILHYFLGFPPYRTGGLTKYAFDLMRSQVENGDKVFALWPGEMSILSKQIKIVQKKDINYIVNYELINPLPVSLDEGILDFEEYMQSCNELIYEQFLKKIAPDVVHIHTLMGLHQEFLCATHKMKIRTVFTTHDYFGICPKVTLYRYGNACENDHDCEDCIQCNCRALSMKKVYILQSPMYRTLKNSAVVRQLRKKHRVDFFSNEMIPNMSVADSEISTMAEKYRELRAYYIRMLSLVDMIHFNSTVTESIYKKYFTPKDSRVLTITHKNIVDNRSVNQWDFTGKLRITSLAPAKPFKGFNVLCSALDDMWESGKRDFKLNLFSAVSKVKPYMNVKEDGFTYNQLEAIFAKTDVLVAPSIWYETFGFTVLEAISYGVPVVVSSHVGSQDIIGNGGIVVAAGNAEELRKAIETLTEEKLEQLRKNVRKNAKIKNWKQFLKENYELYKQKRMLEAWD